MQAELDALQEKGLNDASYAYIASMAVPQVRSASTSRVLTEIRLPGQPHSISMSRQAHPAQSSMQGRCKVARITFAVHPSDGMLYFVTVRCLSLQIWRRKGVASALLAAGERMAGKWHQNWVLLHVYQSNTIGGPHPDLPSRCSSIVDLQSVLKVELTGLPGGQSSQKTQALSPAYETCNFRCTAAVQKELPSLLLPQMPMHARLACMRTWLLMSGLLCSPRAVPQKWLCGDQVRLPVGAAGRTEAASADGQVSSCHYAPWHADQHLKQSHAHMAGEPVGQMHCCRSDVPSLSRQLVAGLRSNLALASVEQPRRL